MFCKHPDPELCKRLGRHVFGGLWLMWQKSPEWRAKWEAEAPHRLADLANLPMKQRLDLGAKPGHRSTPCKHELSVITYCNDIHNEDRHERGCELHDKCTRSFKHPDLKACSLCPDYQGGEDPFLWISAAKLMRDTAAFAGRLPRDLRGIGGVVRSGMIPASYLATALHLPLFEVGEVGLPNQLRHGGRGFNSNKDGKILVVDDSVYFGGAMDRVKKACSGIKCDFAAIYVRRGMQHTVDYYHEQVPDLHMLEWNWANNGPLAGMANNTNYGKGVAVDFDGIICHDELSGGVPESPYMLPVKHPVPLIASGRHENSLPIVKALLSRWGVRSVRIELLPAKTPFTPRSAAEHKARHYLQSGCGVFLESCPTQAKWIHEITQKPVVCPRAETVFQSARPLKS